MLRKLLGLMPFLASACIAQTPPDTPGGGPSPIPGTTITPGPSCDQTVFVPEDLIGRKPDEIGLDRFPFPVRIIRPGMMITMDHLPARLNLHVGADGVITGFRCG